MKYCSQTLSLTNCLPFITAFPCHYEFNFLLASKDFQVAKKCIILGKTYWWTSQNNSQIINKTSWLFSDGVFFCMTFHIHPAWGKGNISLSSNQGLRAQLKHFLCHLVIKLQKQCQYNIPSCITGDQLPQTSCTIGDWHKNCNLTHPKNTLPSNWHTCLIWRHDNSGFL